MADETLTAAEGADAAHGAEHVAAGCVDHGSAVGLPQLCGDWFGNQIFWLVVSLIVLFLIVSRVIIPRIAGTLAERSGTITNNIAAAEELKLRAQEAEAAYEKALADARVEANRIVTDAKADIQKGLDAELARADEEIAAKTAESEAAISEIRASATENVREVAKETAAALVAALGGTADDKAIADAVNAQVKG